MSKCSILGSCGGGGAVYGLGLIGALIYNLQQAVGLGSILLGMGKAIVWPVFMVYDLLNFLGK